MTVELTLHGHRIVFSLPDTSDLIQKKISEAKSFYELDLLEDMRARVHAGGLCVDVGAHLGNHTIFLAKVCGMRVLAFEPQPEMYRLLVEHVRINGVEDRVRTFNVALGDVAGHGTLTWPAESNSGGARLQVDDGGSVLISTLDEHVGAETVDLIKVDVEGFELEVLKGGRRAIDRDKPLIYAEAIDAAARKSLEVYLGPRGYVAGESFCSTPVVSFEHCTDDYRRLSVLSARIESAHFELEANLRRHVLEQGRAVRERISRLDSATKSLDRRLERVNERVAGLGEGKFSRLEQSFAQLAKDSHDQAALLYELWALGIQTYDRIGGQSDVYRALNLRAAQMVDWVPRRQRWTVPKGTDAGAYLQGYSSKVSVRCGDAIEFHLSTDRAPVFVKVRVFGFGDRNQTRMSELEVSPAVAVPKTGVWASGSSEHVDERKWPAVYRLNVSRSWQPGCYIARFETIDGAAVLHPFWVTSRAPQAATLRLCPTITHYVRNRWQAGASSSIGRLFRAQASTVRFPRPFRGSRGGESLRNELPLFRWANVNAVAMDCHTDLEAHANPSLLDDYDHLVIAGDCSYLTRELVDAFGAFAERGGSITVLGAAPGEHEVTIDLEARTITRVTAHRDEWRAANERLWGAVSHWSHKGKALDLAFTDNATSGVLAEGGFAPPVVVDQLCKDRMSGTDLELSDPRLVARAIAGDHRCDTTSRTTEHGGRVFIAGTDRWAPAIDDQFNSRGVRGELDFVTARVLGASTERAEPLVSVIMTAYDSAEYISAAVESILEQSYTNLELIVVDDNSTDSTFELLLDYATKDARVRPFKSFRNNGTYWSKNFGITRARGELITFQDSDDTSTPDRLAEQVQALRWNPAAMGSMVDYERRNERGELLLNRGVTQRRCFPSLMIRAAKVVGRIGYFDSVRTSADQEYLHRLRLVFGADRVVETRSPLYQALVREGSLTTTDGAEVKLDADGRSHLSATRQRYVESFEAWHERIESAGASPYMAFPLAERPFDAPDEIGVHTGRKRDGRPRAEAEPIIESYRASTLPSLDGTERPFTIEPLPDDPDGWQRIVGVQPPPMEVQAPAHRDFDIIMMSDFRFPGGTSQSNAAEITVHARNGITTGLAQVPSPVLKRDHPINPVIERLIDDGSARWIPDDQWATTRLLLIRHPTVLERPIEELPHIRADEVVVIVNQTPTEQTLGREFYDMARCQAKARERFGSAGTWYPIGPLVREAVADVPGNAHLSPHNWSNIIDIDEWPEPGSAFVSDTPVIGRHSRDTPDKWPPDRETILAAYPPELKVRVLGGAAPIEEALGGFPDNWEVLPFGAEQPRDFLRTIDFLVYFHHPTLVEAFGRTILEALAAGVPAIIPHHFRALFEDYAIYAEPDEVLGIVRELYADRARYEELSRAGVEFVRREFSYGAHLERVRGLIGDVGGGAAAPGARAAAAVRTEAAPSTARADSTPAETAFLEPDSIYKVGFELHGVDEASRGRLRGVARETGKEMFDIAIDGTSSAVSEFVVTGERRVHIDVYVDTEAGPDISIARMRARRRAERPKQPTITLTDASVTAAFATYPARRNIVPDVIASLAPQVDRLFVYLNNYDDVPAFVRETPHRDRIAFILDPASQLRAAAKFHWLDGIRGYHLVCDDDIIYPPDYARRMVEAIDRYDRKAILGVHGVIFEPELTDARMSRRSVFKFPAELGEDVPVHFLGTGTVALHSSVLAHMDLSELDAFPIANDEILAVSAKSAGVPMVCIRRSEGWLTPHAGVEFGIFEERQIDSGEHDKATELLIRANPWPELDGAAGKAR